MSGFKLPAWWPYPQVEVELSPLARFVRDISASMVAVLDQDSFRWRNDDGNETTATWIAATNTQISVGAAGDIGLDTNVRLRVLVQETAGTSSGATTWALYAELDTGGGYGAPFLVTTSTTVVKVVLSGNVTDDTQTTQQLGAGTLYVAADSMSRIDENASMTLKKLSASNEGEPEWVLQFLSADLANGNKVRLRVRQGGTVLDTYTNSPEVTVVTTAPSTSGAGWIGAGVW
jgi:hypothetical protein